MKHLKFLFILSLLLLTACSGSEGISSTPTTAEAQSAQDAYVTSTTIRANGILLPEQRLELSFGAGGFVEAVEIRLGETVRAGQLLVSLDATEAGFTLQQAEAQLAAAQANYDLIVAGTPAEQQAAIAAANLDMIAAQQALAAIHANADLAAARALQAVVDAQKDLASAQRSLNGITSTANQSFIDTAYANMILAKAALDKAKEAYEPWQNKPENNTTRATLLSKLAEAQQAYDATVRQYNGLIGNTSEVDIAQAEADLALAQAQLVDAQETYEILKDGPDPDKVALAEAQVTRAQAQLTLVEKGGPTAEQLAQAQAQIDSARANLEIIQSQIDKMVITAPFDGVVSMVRANQGQWASPGEAMIEVLDTSRWRIETKNVGELQIGQIQIGQAVQVSVNAFKGEALNGQITAIAPVAVVQQGDTTYTLLIELEPTELNLWSGMTAQVEIMAGDD